jgi:hypothetical protein
MSDAVTVHSADMQLFNGSLKGIELSDEEKQIVSALFNKSGEDVQVYIPEDIQKETLHSWLVSSSKVRAKLEYAQRKIKPILGRMFVLIQKRKDLLESFGCTSFTQFMNIYVPKHLAISPEEAWSAHWTVLEYPDISCQEYEEVGISKLRMIARAVPRDKNEDIPQDISDKRKKLMEVAKGTRRATELASRIEELGIAKRNEVIKDKIIIFCDLLMREAFDTMCADPRVIQYAGTDHPTGIFAAMMGEFHAAAMSEASVERN